MESDRHSRRRSSRGNRRTAAGRAPVPERDGDEIQIEDPDGNLVELFEPAAAAAFRPEVPPPRRELRG